MSLTFLSPTLKADQQQCRTGIVEVRKRYMKQQAAFSRRMTDVAFVLVSGP